MNQKYFTLFFVSSLIFVFGGGMIFAQTDLLEEKARLTEEVRRIRKEIADEKRIFEEFKTEKQSILAAKQEESLSLKKEIQTKSLSVRRLRREMLGLESKKLAIERQNEEINLQIKNAAQLIQTEIDLGIPFEKEKRKAVLSALIYDIKNTGITANESFARLVNFLNKEQELAFDSQVLRVNMPINATPKDVNLIRLGRVYFAVDDGEGIYLWKKENQEGGYTLNPEALSPFNANAIRAVAQIIQGQQLPDLIAIPVPLSDISKREGN